MPRRSLLLLLLLGCSPKPVPTTAVASEAHEVAGIHNLHRVAPNLWSGSSPEGDAGFKSLKSLGVKTVISVDGATPDVAAAEKQGIRYVHLPVGYHGIGRDRALELAKAVRDLPGPVYVHCHHGKHRGPAAIAAIQLCLDPSFTPEQAEGWMMQAGTDPRYKGLFELPRTLRRPTTEDLDRVSSEFPSVNRVADLAKWMVEIDATWDKLKAAEAAGWKNPAASAGDAVLLIEQYREVKRLPLPQKQGFAKYRETAEAEASKLEQALRVSDTKGATAAFLAGKSVCQKCHDDFRDRAE